MLAKRRGRGRRMLFGQGRSRWGLAALVVLLRVGAARAQDADGDGLSEPAEQEAGTNSVAFDTDGDGLSDGEEVGIGTSPLSADTDGDGLPDFSEVRVHGTSPLNRDSDGGGSGDAEEVLVHYTNPLVAADDEADSDEDGLWNQLERRLGSNPFLWDTDGDLLSDAAEDVNGDGLPGGDRNENGRYEPASGDETNPLDPDADDDGLVDGLERYFESDPFNPDTDGDGITDGDEVDLRNQGSTCLDPTEADSDFDGIDDNVEIESGLAPCDADSDQDGVLDMVEVLDGTDPLDPESANEDQDRDGLSDLFEQGTLTDPALFDSDGDGLSDAEEILALVDRFETDPLDADTDDDGLLDSAETGPEREGTHPLEADTDKDGTPDGLEVGLAVPQVSALDPDATAGVWQPDMNPATTTDPLSADTDGDGLGDGFEDQNHDGAVQPAETDPNIPDTDGDGMPDGWEVRYSPRGEGCPAAGVALDPRRSSDAVLDFDNDGLTNLEEYELRVRLGIVLVAASTHPCLADTDGDGLTDAVEAGSNYGTGQTDPTVADTDDDGLLDAVEDANKSGRWETGETSPVRSDTDWDRLPDGIEDANLSGVVDGEETDPRIADTDGDGLGDGEERLLLGTDPLTVDTDGDGVQDGVERGVAGDRDPATKTDPTRADTDGDGISDGVEDANHDGDFSGDETNPTDLDTDDDTLSDGLEDINADGVWASASGETNPRLADTDGGGVDDATELAVNFTNPNDPSDDFSRAGPISNPVDPPLEPPASEPIDDRWGLEEGAEIRGSGCAVRSAPAGGGSLTGLLLGIALGLRRKFWRRRAPASCAVALSVGVSASSVDAQTLPSADLIAESRNTDLDANPFRLTPGGLGVLGVGRARVLPHLGWRTTVGLQHLSDSVLVVDRASGRSLRSLVGGRQELSLTGALGIAERFQVALGLPIVLHQSALLPGQGLGEATDSGFGSPWLTPSAVLCSQEQCGAGLVFEAPLTLPLWNAPAYMGYQGLGIEPRLIGERRWGPVSTTLALGVLLRTQTEALFNIQDSNQTTFGASVAYWDIRPGLDVTLDALGATPLAAFGASDESRGEALLGVRRWFDSRLSATLGAGAGILSGMGQPSYRLLLALAFGSERPDARLDVPAPLLDCGTKEAATDLAECAEQDLDADGVVNRQDECLDEPEDRDGDADEDGCPEEQLHPSVDRDADGRLDSEDECVDIPEDPDGYEDEDGCPDPDNDSDGIVDAADRCPLDPEDEPQGPAPDGCPKPAMQCSDGAVPTADGRCLARLETEAIYLTQEIGFSSDTARLAPESRAALDQVVDILDAHPQLRVHIVGHTDAKGSQVLNRKLSLQRAESVRRYLISQSNSPRQLARRLRVEGRGEAQPIDNNKSAVGRRRNRRVEFLIDLDSAAPPKP